jgi:hypothetical protein
MLAFRMADRRTILRALEKEENYHNDKRNVIFKHVPYTPYDKIKNVTLKHRAQPRL